MDLKFGSYCYFCMYIKVSSRSFQCMSFFTKKISGNGLYIILSSLGIKSIYSIYGSPI